jgi:competence ComEA-like helix-hairpin-helix protein
VTRVRARGGPGAGADVQAAAACLGVLLLGGTALSSLWTSGAYLSPGGVPIAASGTVEQTPTVAAGPPQERSARPETPDDGHKAAPTEGLNINRADAIALQGLPGVGPALAKRIVDYREAHGPFRMPADLLEIPGIGAKRYARLHGLLRTADTP